MLGEAAGDEDGGVEALRQVEEEQVGALLHRAFAAHIALEIYRYSRRQEQRFHLIPSPD